MQGQVLKQDECDATREKTKKKTHRVAAISSSQSSDNELDEGNDKEDYHRNHEANDKRTALGRERREVFLKIEIKTSNTCKTNLTTLGSRDKGHDTTQDENESSNNEQSQRDAALRPLKGELVKASPESRTLA